jgi:hypothetical protein
MLQAMTRHFLIIFSVCVMDTSTQAGKHMSSRYSGVEAMKITLDLAGRRSTARYRFCCHGSTKLQRL